MTPQLPDRVRLPFVFDPSLLERDPQSVATFDWIKHFVPQNYEGDWSVIPLRAKVGATHLVMMISSDPTATAFEDTPMLQGCRYFREVLDASYMSASKRTSDATRDPDQSSRSTPTST